MLDYFFHHIAETVTHRIAEHVVKEYQNVERQQTLSVMMVRHSPPRSAEVRDDGIPLHRPRRKRTDY